MRSRVLRLGLGCEDVEQSQGGRETAMSNREQLDQAPGDEAAQIALSRNGELCTLVLAGSIDIGSAEEFKAALLEGFKGARRVQVSLDAVTGLDVTALQLLWAAQRAAAQTQMDFSICGARADALENQMTELGMEHLKILT